MRLPKAGDHVFVGLNGFRHRFSDSLKGGEYTRPPGSDLLGVDLVGARGVVLGEDPRSSDSRDPFFLVRVGKERLMFRLSEITLLG